MNVARSSLKEQAREIFVRTLTASALLPAMERMVMVRDGVLRIGALEYALRNFDRVLMVAIGKAAAPMAAYCADLLRAQLPVTGLVVGPATAALPGELKHLQGAHPLPDEISREAAMTALEMARGADAKTLVLWLVSGGASAMLEAPLDERLSTEDVAGFHKALVHSGFAIGEMNTVRKHLSAVKGGRLAVAAKHAGAQLTLLVSDVPEGQTDVISSGPTLPDASTVADCRALLKKLKQPLPERVKEWFAGEFPETPKAGNAAFERSEYVMLLSSETMCEQASIAAREMGFEPVVDNGCDEWGYVEAADYLLSRLKNLKRPVALITAGELSVPVTGPAGVGGRNSHFALHMAKLIVGMKDVVVLSAGSDGIDGHSAAAGAVADGETWERASDAAAALKGFDSGTVFAALGDAIVTGPTGNNLRDLRVFLAK